MVLENVKEMWTETPKLASGKKGRPVNKDRFISKMYVSLTTSPAQPNPPHLSPARQSHSCCGHNGPKAER